MEKEAVRKVIEEGYLKAVYLKRNPEVVEKAFHPQFTMAILEKNEIVKWSAEDFIGLVRKNKEKNPNAPIPPITFDIPYIDVTENEAIAKVETFHNGNKIYTDYLSLYKFEEGWRIVCKIYHQYF